MLLTGQGGTPRAGPSDGSAGARPGWVAEGLAFWSRGARALLERLGSGGGTLAATRVYRASAGMLVGMAAWWGLTGARTSILPTKRYPGGKTVVAAMNLVASLL